MKAIFHSSPFPYVNEAVRALQDPALWKCELHRVPPVQGKWARQFHHLRVQGPVVDAGASSLHPFLPRKKLDVAGEVESWMNRCWRASLMYSSLPLCSQDGQRIHSTLASEAGLITLEWFWYWRTGSGWGWCVSGGWAPPAHPLESRPGIHHSLENVFGLVFCQHTGQRDRG